MGDRPTGKASAVQQMTAAPTIAVIIVNYNSGAWLQRCVTALAQQTFADFEAIILDNASSDGSFSLAETPPDGRFRFIGGATNLGFAAGNNLAIAATTAPWIATLNPDAIPEIESGLIYAIFVEEVRPFTG